MGSWGGNSPALDPATLPLYKTISDLVHDPSLWKDGGHIGYHCSNIYPHTTSTKLHFMAPDNLKGADMAMYSIFGSLGLKVSFRPAMERDDMGHEPSDSDTESDGYGGHVGTEEVVLGADGKLRFEGWYGGEDGTHDEMDVWVGKRAEDPQVQPRGGYSDEPVLHRVPSYLRYKDVHWINHIGHKEIQAAYLAVSTFSLV